jgi:spore coat protein A, manganese oxidase
MRKRSQAVIIAAVFLLCAVGGAGAQTGQTLLPGALIPKFVDPLPVAGQISVVNATPAPLLDIPSTPAYNISMKEFQAQILPSTGVPANPKAGFLGLLPNTPSWVWGYLTDADVLAQNVPTPPTRSSYLGPVVVAKKGVETKPTYINALPYGTNSRVQPLLPTDQTLDWADPLGTGCAGQAPTGACAGIYSGPQPAVPHIHGGEVAPAYDGGPDAWWTPDAVQSGLGFPGTTFTYPTEQQAGTIWFHDHALGVTRLNVFAGMAGLYIITDPANEPAAGVLPAFPQHDIPLIIQDRSFDVFGQIYYNLASNPQPNPTVHPYWIPEFIGDTILVNGKTWPYLNVEPRKYRFRLVNGSNARHYDLKLSNNRSFLVIATDDGYLDAAVSTPNLIIAPGERYEIVVDFSGLKVGTALELNNSARTPFPGGANVVRGTTDTVMQFRVVTDSGLPNATVVAGTNLRTNNAIINIKNVVPGIKRQLTLNEVIGPGGPLELVLNNTKYNKVITGFSSRDSEQPAVGDTELWEIINITADAHPIHTHLASFQIVNRQAFQASKWITAYTTALLNTYGGPTIDCPNCPDGEGPPNLYLTANTDGAIGGNPAIGPYLQGKPKPPLAYENGWKDTAVMYPGEVTRIMVRWAPTDVQAPGSINPATGQPYDNCPVGAPLPSCASSAGVNLYPFNPTELIGGVGYVWHCHIVDHEDNEMMRPYVVGPARQIIQ